MYVFPSRRLCLQRWGFCNVALVGHEHQRQTWKRYYLQRSHLEENMSKGRPGSDYTCKSVRGHTGKRCIPSLLLTKKLLCSAVVFINLLWFLSLLLVPVVPSSIMSIYLSIYLTLSTIYGGPAWSVDLQAGWLPWCTWSASRRSSQTSAVETPPSAPPPQMGLSGPGTSRRSHRRARLTRSKMIELFLFEL